MRACRRAPELTATAAYRTNGKYISSQAKSPLATHPEGGGPDVRSIQTSRVRPAPLALCWPPRSASCVQLLCLSQLDYGTKRPARPRSSSSSTPTRHRSVPRIISLLRFYSETKSSIQNKYA